AAGTGTTPPAPAGETPPSESTTPTGETPGEPTPAEGEITPAKPTAGAVWIVKGPAKGIDTVYEELPDNQILVRIVNKDDHTKEIGRKTISRPSTNDKTEFRKVIEQAGKDLYAPIIRQKEIEEEEKSLGEGEWSAEENNKKGYETQGWKLHLNVDRETAEAIHEFLMREGVHHKIGRSGGQEGKAMTIYAGSRDLANALAETINQKFGGRIQAPKGNVLDDDRQIVGNIWGRFDIGRKNNKYHQYGHGGVPILNADAKHIETQRMSDRLLKEEKTPEEYWAMWKEAAQKAEKLLEKEYGVYFTGTKKPPETTPTMTTTPVESTPSVDTPTASLESRIFEAYMAETGGKDRQQVRLADFRKRFPDTPREELDAELKRMKSEGKILLIPQDDPLQIKDADREAAINIAGRDNHLIIIEGEKMG
ncbi:MAG TPA: hypothetical protein PK360_00170, partial [bacterium]|nr:hypothetical protein [bacterium]